MNDAQLGALFRAVRIHLRLRQEDVAGKARVSQATVSRVERGHIGVLPINHLRAVAGVLEIRLDVVPSWRGGDLERLVNARHTALHERLAARIAGAPGWVSAAEVSFSIWGERGVIDRLAFHAERRVLAVFEIKPDLGAPADLVCAARPVPATRSGDRAGAWLGGGSRLLLGRGRGHGHQQATAPGARGAAAWGASGGRRGVPTMAGGSGGGGPRTRVSRISASADWYAAPHDRQTGPCRSNTLRPRVTAGACILSVSRSAATWGGHPARVRACGYAPGSRARCR